MNDTQTPPKAADSNSGVRNRLVFVVLLGLQAGLYGWAALFFTAEDGYMAIGLGAVATLFGLGALYMLARATAEFLTPMGERLTPAAEVLPATVAKDVPETAVATIAGPGNGTDAISEPFRHP